MGTKQVRLDEDVYAKIEDKKRADETFSEAIDRMIDDWSLTEFSLGLSDTEQTEFREAVDSIEDTTTENVNAVVTKLDVDDDER